MKTSTQGIMVLLMAVSLSACSPSCFLSPKTEFRPESLAASPDYSKLEAWAAHPDKKSNAKMVPPGLERAKSPKADVFYIYPTVWFDREVWNDDLSNAKSLELVDEVILAGQASAFGGCCRVFAPRYRQTTLGAFYGPKADAEASLSVAYSDVERAFEAFLEASEGRPFIIASHSQGSMHAFRLLEQIQARPDLQARLVAAYTPGYARPTTGPTVPVCDGPRDTGCVLAWDTYAEEAEALGHEPMWHWEGASIVRLPTGQPRTCVNPITWAAGEQASSRAKHRGAVQLDNRGDAVTFFGLLFSDDPAGADVVGLKAPQPGMVPARCAGSFLRVPELDALDYPVEETQPGNYHLLDYELFYVDIWYNAIQRVDAWQHRERGDK